LTYRRGLPILLATGYTFLLSRRRDAWTSKRENLLNNRERRDLMGDKGGKKNKEKGQKQNTEKQKQKSKNKLDKQPKRKP
jgi:hypothetical protein